MAAGRSAAGFIRIVRSRQKVSLFRLSGAATHHDSLYVLELFNVKRILIVLVVQLEQR